MTVLFRQHILDGIRAGTITTAFRRWRRPTVRPGGTLLTAAGQLEIRAVEPISEASITEHDAARAGFESRAELLAELNRRPSGDLFRIDLGALREDPRTALREQRPDAGQLTDTLARLDRLDRAASSGAWTTKALALIRDRPGVRAGDLADVMRMEKDRFKVHVRKLKQLGLTESLERGYRLSPRGEAVCAARGSETR